MNQADLVAMLLANLREACEGPVDPDNAWFNSDKNRGLIGALANIDAAAASHAPTPGAKTIAAHVAHAAFHLKASAAWLGGNRAAASWKTTWDPPTVDRADWIALQQLLRRCYDDTAVAITQVQTWTTDELGGAIGAVAHAAYHLGAIRQIIRVTTPPKR